VMDTWTGAGIFTRDNKASTAFPLIKTFYVEINSVMQAYISGKKINPIKW